MLSDRIRNNIEAAPWVVQEVKLMEAYIKQLEDALYDSLALNLNWVSTALKSDLEYHSEYAAVIKQAKKALKLSKNPKMHDL
jgi:hypothetical protein